MSITRHDPEGLRFPGMSQAVRAGGWVHVSGQVALKDGVPLASADAATQAAQCFANLLAALAAAGATPAQVVKLGCHLTDRAAYPAWAAERNRLFGAHPPASTVVVVKELLVPGLLMEVEAIAWTG